MRARYGTDEQQAIVTATTAKLIYGGMSNGNDLRDVSGWAGEFREPQVTLYAGGTSYAQMATSPTGPGRPGLAGEIELGRQHAVSGLYRLAMAGRATARCRWPPISRWLGGRGAQTRSAPPASRPASRRSR